MITVVDVEGVLAEEGQKIPQAASSPSGSLLYQHLKGERNALLLLSEDRTEAPVKDWLLKENMSTYVKLVTRGSSLLEPLEWRVDALKTLISSGSHVSFYVGSEPSIASEVAALGITYLLVVPGNGKAGQMTPDLGYRSWDHLTDIMDERRLREAQIEESLRRQEQRGA